MNEVIKNMLTRRSIRTYKEEQISEEYLSAILEAAKYAPSGGNSQTWRFTVVQNKEKLEQLNSLVREAFRNLEVDEKTYLSKKSGKKAAEKDSYRFYYNAPTLVRHPPQSGWLDELGRLKGDRPINPNVALKRASVP